MSAPLDGIANYSAFVYALAERHPFVKASTLVLAPIGTTLAKLEGQITCRNGIRVEVWELVDFAAQQIRSYSYEVYKEDEQVCWYDAWAHPEIPALASTFSTSQAHSAQFTRPSCAGAGNQFVSAEFGCGFE